uniref:Uncharacterized protein n=1 Tax=Timema shepardi TaxID=629360 RepID=A0A7R9AQD6_TIMSH|nr:unnamed protein product [Timema shepardi]
MRFGPCDLQDPLWVKMSTAISGGVNKKRKKTDTKPQSQINKCLNEKRRREQENIYIEELAELISASFVDMSSRSVKPDKCAILQETVNQIRHIKQQEGTSSDAVQQGEVSSSKPTILANDVIGPLLLEALEGFLFVVNTEGKVEYVTENVSQFIKYTKDDVLGESIYNIIHHGDHARFSSFLLPMSIGWTNDSQTASKNRDFTCRLLIKPPDDQDETMEEKQQRVSKYENMQISSTLLPFPSEKTEGGSVTSESAEVGPCLMCVARRIPQNEKSIGNPIEQFTTKLDVSGKIISIDTSGVSSTYSQYLNKELVGHIIQELCPQQDLQKLASHLKETLHSGSSTSSSYRLHIMAPDKFIHVQTKSKLFKANSSMAEPDFIMATHSIIGDNELQSASDCGHFSNSSPSPVNGSMVTSSGFAPATSSDNTITLNASSSYATFTLTGGELSLNEYDYFPSSSTWDILSNDGSYHRPDSRQSPHSVPSYSPAGPGPSPYQPATQPSPARANTPANTFSNSFPFSPLQEQGLMLEEVKDSKDGIVTEVNGSGESLVPGESGRLRNLLTKRCSTSTDDGEDQHRILKGLLNQEDEDDTVEESGVLRGSPASHRGRLGSTEANKTSTGNNMLLKLLNERNDEDDLEHQKQNELLQQLMKKQDEERKPPLSIDTGQHSNHLGAEDHLLKSLGFTSHNSPSPPSSDSLGLVGGRKRPSDEGEEPGPAKRGAMESLGPPMHHGEARGSSSKLWEKNKMLASLLAKQPSTPTTIPPLPPSIITATPQDKLPRILDRVKHQSQQQAWSGGSLQPPSCGAGGPGRPTQHSVDTRAGQATIRHPPPPNRHPNSSFLNQILNQQQEHHQLTQQQQQQALLHSQQLHKLQQQVSQLHLSPNSTTILNILDAIDSPANIGSIQQELLNEKKAIHEIQKALMQCESDVNSPSSPTMSLPGTPPAYTASSLPSQATQQSQGFPPPPVYQQRPRFSIQQAGRPGAPQYSTTANTLANQQFLRSKVFQQQQKQRLLQAQQQQQLLIPSNAAADQLAASGIQNIDSLLNNTVAPNVSLQRSSSVPDSQLSPGYNTQMIGGGSQISPGQRLNQQPYSPHSQLASPLGQQQSFSPVSSGMNNFTSGQQGTQARLSPHPPGGLPSFQPSQLSPRISQGQQAYSVTLTQGGLTQTSPAPSNWSQAAANRLSIQQQQNPMLNAQLTLHGFVVHAPAHTAKSPLYGQRSIDQYGVWRVSGAVASSRLYGLKQEHPPHPLLSPGPMYHHQHPHHLHHSHMPPHPMMYPPHPQSDSPFCFDQPSLQIYGPNDRGRSQPTNHQPGGAGDSPKLWGSIGSDMGSGSPQPGLSSRNTMEESPRPGDQKSSSLLQKLLSE